MPQHAAQRECYSEQLRANGYVRSACVLDDTDMVSLMGTFHELIDDIYDQPSDSGQRIFDAFATNVPGRELNSKGFIDRRRIGEVSPYEIGRSPATEDKDLLHFTPQTAEAVTAAFGTRMPKLVRALLGQCQDVYQAMSDSLRPVTAAYGLEDVIFAPKGSEADNIHILRLLGYPGKPGAVEAGQAMSKAELHLDRSKFSAVGAWESRSGLVGIPAQNGYLHPEITANDFNALAKEALKSPIACTPGQAIIFLGAGFNHLPYDMRANLDPDVPLLLHGFHDHQPELPRDTAVLFANEQRGVPGIGSPEAYETGFSDIIKFLLARERMQFAEPANS